MIIACNTDISHPPKSPKDKDNAAPSINGAPVTKTHTNMSNASSNETSAIPSGNNQNQNSNDKSKITADKTDTKNTTNSKNTEIHESAWNLDLALITKIQKDSTTLNLEPRLQAELSFTNENTPKDTEDPSTFKASGSINLKNIKEDNDIQFLLPRVFDDLIRFGVGVKNFKNYTLSAAIADTCKLSLTSSDQNNKLEFSVDTLKLLSIKNETIKEVSVFLSRDTSIGKTSLLANGLSIIMTLELGSLKVKITFKLSRDDNKHQLYKEFTIQIDNTITITISLNKTYELFTKTLRISNFWNNLLGVITEIGFKIDGMQQIQKFTSSESKVNSCKLESKKMEVFEETHERQYLTTGGQ